MHFSTFAGAALTAASVAMAKELPKDELRAAGMSRFSKVLRMPV